MDAATATGKLGRPAMTAIAEAADGDIEYRLVFIKNTHGTLTLFNPLVWIANETMNAGDSIHLAIADEVKAETETIADETVAPVGPSFTDAIDEGSAIVFPDLAPGEYQGIWVKRTIGAGSALANDRSFDIHVKGETEA